MPEPPRFCPTTAPWCLVLAIGLAIGLSSACASRPPRPNFVVFLADDQGWGDLSVNGNTNLATPNIDSLARDGATLEHFYVSPVCSPTRAELLTGRYHPRGGVRGTGGGAERLDLDERTLAELLRAQGYATGAFGKWHNGAQHPYHPNARGFDTFYGFTVGHAGHYFDAPMDHDGRSVQGRGFMADDFTDKALAFIEENRDRPFFCYLPYNTPHSPMQVPDRFWAKFADAPLPRRYAGPEPEDLGHTRAALAMVENLDWNVGRVLARLETLGLADETVVVYLSDNGPNGWRWNGGMKGRKGTIDEGGLRVPFMVRWPGRIAPGSRVPQIAAAIDLFPTFAAMAGIPVPSDRALDGKSLTPLLLGQQRTWPDRILFAFRGGREVSVRNQRFRLDAQGRLFDIEADPGQHTDVSAQFPAVAQELQRAATAMAREVLTDGQKDDRPLPVGHAPGTVLPAGEAVAAGGVERSNRFPNSSYFTRWRSPDGAITWDVEVARPGLYDVVVHYACPASDLGTTLELGFAGQSARGQITAAHDPPLVGAAQDRVPRAESYVKPFAPLSLGKLRLSRGRGPLVLRAPHIAGDRGPEVWSVTLTRAGD